MCWYNRAAHKKGARGSTQASKRLPKTNVRSARCASDDRFGYAHAWLRYALAKARPLAFCCARWGWGGWGMGGWVGGGGSG